MKMQFGKYCGEEVGSLPRPYREWLLTIRISDALRAEVMKTLMEQNQVKGNFTTAKAKRVQLEENKKVYKPGEPCRLYTDGGVHGQNPSERGGAWAWRLIDCDGTVLEEDCGYVTPADVCLPAVTNNITELLAVVHGLEAMPDRWIGTVCLDSDCTRLRMIGRKPSWTATPQAIYNRARQAQARMGKLYWQLLAGHPERGKHEWLPQSEHNAACDRMCNLLMEQIGV